MLRRRRRPTDPPPPGPGPRPASPPSPDAAWLAWRDEALRPATARPQAGAPVAGIVAVVVDFGYPPAWATVVVPGDADPTVAASDGGRASAPSAHTTRVLEAAAATLHLVPLASAAPLPPVGSVAFHVLAGDGWHSLTVPEADLRRLEHPLTLLFSAVQAVLADLRPR